jgi:hypothetical protein
MRRLAMFRRPFGDCKMNAQAPARVPSRNLPALMVTSGEPVARRFLDFFTSNIRNRNTREAYGRAVASI